MPGESLQRDLAEVLEYLERLWSVLPFEVKADVMRILPHGLDPLIAALQAAETPRSPSWQPIATASMALRFPPQYALLWHPNWKRAQMGVVNCGEWISEGKIVKPTHWMPLPPPPASSLRAQEPPR